MDQNGRYTFDDLKDMPTPQLEGVLESCRQDLAAAKQERFNLIGRIMFYQEAAAKERGRAAPAPSTGDAKLDKALNRFRDAIADKLRDAAERKGRSGWDDPNWPVEEIQRRLTDHIAKGDPRDVAAFCLFLWARDASTASPAPAPGSAEVEALCERLEAGDAAVIRRQAEELKELREGRLEGIWSQARENHERYSATGSVEQDIRFFGLGLAGEAGEVANFIKKRWRDGDGHDADLRAECADVLAYTMMLAHALGMTPEGLIAEVARKQEVFIEKMRARALLKETNS